MLDTVETHSSCGRLRGVTENGLAIFRAVPFAQAPVGSLRFQAPQAIAPWPGVRDATRDGPICPQLPARLMVMGPIDAAQGEDCLTLNVWSPLPLDQKRPILVWFHGGGYSSGAGSLPWYDGGRWAREHDVVTITVNYRVGALGYLCRPGLADGNMGLLDQLLALQWIRDNANSLGGDAERITLMGQSGGSHSIACMLAMPHTRHLVRQAILLSTAFGFRNLTPADARAHADQLCTELGIDPDHPAALERLQSAPVESILQAQLAVIKSSARAIGDVTPAFAPTATGALPGGVAFDEASCEGAREVRALIGTTADEARAFYAVDPRLKGLTAEALPQLAGALFGASWQERIAAARRMRPGATALEAFADAETTRFFVEGAERFAVATAGGHGKAWVFRFDWCPPGSAFGACHCIDLPFVFGTFEAFARAPMLDAIDEQKQALSAVLRGALARFVHTGSPDGNDLPTWPPFTRADPAVLVFDRTVRCGRSDLRSL